MKTTFEIKYVDGDVLYSCQAESARDAVEQAVKAHADLTCANLAEANLSYADLTDAHLMRADLSGAILTDTCLDEPTEESK